MYRSATAATLLATTLFVGCATAVPQGEESELLERVRGDVRLDPLMSSSRVTVTERDGVIVFGGSVDSLQDLNVVRDVALEIEDEAEVRNTVVYSGEGEDDDPTAPDT